MAKPTFKSTLTRTNKAIKGERATLIAEMGKMDFRELWNEKIMRRSTLKLEKIALTDLSTDNVSTTLNRVTPEEFKDLGLVRKMHTINMELIPLEEEIEILKEQADYWGVKISADEV